MWSSSLNCRTGKLFYVLFSFLQIYNLPTIILVYWTFTTKTGIYFWYRSMHILYHYLGMNTIQNICWNLNFYTFVRQSSKPYLIQHLLNAFCSFIVIIMYVIHFLYFLTLIIGFNLFVHIRCLFPSSYRLCISILFFGHKICIINIFKIMVKFVNNRCFYQKLNLRDAELQMQIELY